MNAIKKILKSRRARVAIAGAVFAALAELGVPGLSEATVLEIVTLTATLILGISIDKEKTPSDDAS